MSLVHIVDDYLHILLDNVKLVNHLTTIVSWPLIKITLSRKIYLLYFPSIPAPTLNAVSASYV
jgi:hypothetical protein